MKPPKVIEIELPRRDREVSLREPPEQHFPPMSEWNAVQDPTAYAELRSGLWVAMYEGIADRLCQAGQLEAGGQVLLNLIKMTKVGRPKADINLGKTMAEVDLSHLSEEELVKLIGTKADA